MRIGSVTLDNITIMAPLAGITNLPLRLLAKKAGCALVCSEMISAHGLVHASRKTLDLLDSVPEEKPLSVQIFGSDPEIMAEAAAKVAQAGADIVDINFGCSVKKIVKTRSGVALMRTPRRAEALLKSVRKSIDLPLTIKIRSGWDRSGEQAFEIAAIAEACGVDAVTLHPRTASQGFGGQADWELIAALKERVSIPVIGNGDIWSAEDGIRMMKTTGCDAVMIGRAAIGYPWIFTQIVDLLDKRKTTVVDTACRFRAMTDFLESSVIYFGEKRACYMMRSRLGWFVKGMRYSSRFREAIKHITSADEARNLIRDYVGRLGGVL